MLKPLPSKGLWSSRRQRSIETSLNSLTSLLMWGQWSVADRLVPSASLTKAAYGSGVPVTSLYQSGPWTPKPSESEAWKGESCSCMALAHAKLSCEAPVWKAFVRFCRRGGCTASALQGNVPRSRGISKTQKGNHKNTSQRPRDLAKTPFGP